MGSSKCFVDKATAPSYSCRETFYSGIRSGLSRTSICNGSLSASSTEISYHGKDPYSYRPIALAPTLSKVFERCILIIYNSAFFTSPLQFGFKKGYSTTLCSGLIKKFNVISHYVFRGSRVFGCFLDASKAFDRVDHHALFQKLLRPPVVVRLLLFWYQQQAVQVRW